MVAAAFAFQGTKYFGHFQNAGILSAQMGAATGHIAGALFAIVLLDASLLGAAAVTLSTSYALGDVFGTKHSLHRSWRDAKAFYAIFSLLVAVAVAIVLTPKAPLGLITTGVQALAGVLLPSAIVFLLLLCNDRAVLGPWVNSAWLNLVAGTIVGILVALSLMLTANTLFPSMPIRPVVAVLATLLSAGVLIGVVITVKSSLRSASSVDRSRRATWTMPALALLERPVWSPSRKAGMYILRGYLLLSVVMLVVKSIELGLSGH